MARGVGRWAIERRARATEQHSAGEWEVAPLGRFGSREKAQRVIDKIVVPHDDKHDFRPREVGGAGGAETRKTVQVLLRVSPAARDAIDRVAERRGLDRSATLAALAIEADAAGRLPPPRHRCWRYTQRYASRSRPLSHGRSAPRSCRGRCFAAMYY